MPRCLTRRGRVSRGKRCYDGGGRGGEDDRRVVSAPRAAVAIGSLLSLRFVNGPCIRCREIVTFLRRPNSRSALTNKRVTTMRIFAR